MFATAGLPPLGAPPPPDAPAHQREQYERLRNAWSRARKTDARIAAFAAVSMVLGTMVAIGLFVYSAPNWEERAELRRQENRAAILSCIDRGGYVIEDRFGLIKECRGVQRAP